MTMGLGQSGPGASRSTVLPQTAQMGGGAGLWEPRDRQPPEALVSSLTSFEQVKGLESRTATLACGNHLGKGPSGAGREEAQGSLWRLEIRHRRYSI